MEVNRTSAICPSERMKSIPRDYILFSLVRPTLCRRSVKLNELKYRLISVIRLFVTARQFEVALLKMGGLPRLGWG